MNKTLLKTIIFGAVFAVAAVVIFFSSGNSDEKKLSYTVLGEREIPVMYFAAQEHRINPVRGYVGGVAAGEAMETLIPLDEGKRIPFYIEPAGSNVTGITYEVRSLDGADLIEKSNLESWQINEAGETEGEIRIKDIIESGRQYMLAVKLTTERRSDITYYTRIVSDPDIHAAEMLEYVTDFHRSAFDAALMEKYAINWEPDNTADNEDLSYVNIHSSFRNLTYLDLEPEEIGAAKLSVLDMDGSFGSFRYDFDLHIRDEEGENDTYSVTEFFCIQWTKQRFYLMKYERHMTQLFSVSRTCVTPEAINLGIVGSDDVQLLVSPSETSVAFVVDGALWCHNRETGAMAEIFSMGEAAGGSGRVRRDYGIRITGVHDDGSVDFFVYGYMNRGRHEGENGLSYYRYDAAGGALSEPLYMPTVHSYGVICQWIDTICREIDGQIYFLFDNTLYSMDTRGAELVRMVENASEHRLIVNASKDTIAWSVDGEEKFPGRIRIRALDGAETILLSAQDGEYLMGEGFVDRDFVFTRGVRSEAGFFGFEELLPRYALSVTDITGTETARYEKEGIYISSVKTGEGKITLERLRAVDGGYSIIEDEVLMQNVPAHEKKKELLTASLAEKRRKIKAFPWKSDGGMDLSIPAVISYYEGSTAAPDAGDTVCYMAFSEGRLAGLFEDAGEAILYAYDSMGWVTDSRGLRVWNRTAKSLVKKTAKLPADIRADASAADILALLPEDRVVSLRDCGIRQLLRFIDRGSAVAFLDGNGAVRFLTGYDPQNAWIYDAASGETEKMTQDQADELIAAGNRRIVSFIPD